MSRSSFASWAAASGAVIAFVFGLFPLRGTGAWWHLTLGRLIAANRAVPTSNPLVYTSASDTPLIVQPWIGDYWLAEIHRMGGVAALLGTRNLLAALAVTIVSLAAYRRCRNARVSAIAAVAVGFVLIALTSVGPSMFALPLAALTAAVSYRVLDDQSPPWSLVVVVAAGWFWANLSPGFWLVPAALASVALAAAMRKRRRVALAALVSTILTTAVQLLTPWGLGITAAIGFDVVEAATFATMGTALALVKRWPELPARRRKLPWTAAAVVFCAGFAALSQPWFVWQPSVLASLHGNVRAEEPMRGLVDDALPVEGMQIVRAWGSRPRIFHPPQWAGYIAFELEIFRPMAVLWTAPDLAADSTTALHDRLVDQPEDVWRGIFQQHDVRAVIVPPSAYPKLVEELDRDDAWEQVWRGEDAVLFSLRPSKRRTASPRDAHTKNAPPGR